MSTLRRAPILSLTHGGGPLPILNDPNQATITSSLRTRVASELETARPSAIILVTAHWEAEVTTVTATERPELYYDYYGFPSEAYEFKYPAPGAPDVAERVVQVLKDKGLAVKKEARGWDHGVFVPMILARPQADIPIVQMSVFSSQDPAQLFALGEALIPLREENIAIIGSGSASFHNMRHFFSGLAKDQKFVDQHKNWRQTLDSAVKSPDAKERLKKLKGWREWSGSEIMHPRGKAEHFSPLIVCSGAVGDLSQGGKIEGWEDEMIGLKMQNWVWKDV